MPALKPPSCLSCGSPDAEVWATAKDLEYKTSDDAFTLLRCHACGVLFIDPVPRDRLAEIYPHNYYSFVEQKSGLVNSVKEFLDGRFFGKILRSLPGKTLNALDVGGGAGWQLNVLRKVEPRIAFTQVVDIDPNAAALAGSNGHEYFCGPIEDFQTDKKFDLILLLNLIEHVENPRAVLGKIRELLSPTGCILIKTPNYDSLDARKFRNANWGGYHCPRHWVIFTRPSFTDLTLRAGLKVRSCSFTQGAPFWTTSVLFWLDKKGIVSVTRSRPAMSHPLFAPLAALFAAFDFARKPFSKTSQMFFVLGR